MRPRKVILCIAFALMAKSLCGQTLVMNINTASQRSSQVIYYTDNSQAIFSANRGHLGEQLYRLDAASKTIKLVDRDTLLKTIHGLRHFSIHDNKILYVHANTDGSNSLKETDLQPGGKPELILQTEIYSQIEFGPSVSIGSSVTFLPTNSSILSYPFEVEKASQFTMQISPCEQMLPKK